MEAQNQFVEEHIEVRPGRVLHICRHVRENGESGDNVGPSGRPVMLFVHGAGGRKEQWQAQLEHFRDTHDVLAFDMVGHGQSDKSGQTVDWHGYGTTHLRQDLLAIVRRFVDPKQKEDNVLVAHSYGTVISVKLLAHLHAQTSGDADGDDDSSSSSTQEEDQAEDHGYGGYFGKVVLIGAANDRPQGTAHPIWYLPAFVLEWIRPALGKGFVDKAWHPATDRELVLREASIAATNPMHVMRPLFREMDWTLEEVAHIADVRFLLISGARDGLTPAESAEALAQRLKEKNSVSVEVLDDAAHMPHMEVPHAVNSLIRAFLDATVE